MSAGLPEHAPVLDLLAGYPLGQARLDGRWEFRPGDHDLAELGDVHPLPIDVPGLWEAQGHLELDGVAWYRRRFDLAEVSGYWALHFGAVMDLSEVFLNGIRVGAHDQPFTPFELDVTSVVQVGTNVLDVRVLDPALDDPLHIRMAHGKQGWANHVFPSRPSLYMTYGGIWQPVTLRRHGPVSIRDIFVNGDPAAVRATVELTNHSSEPISVEVGIRTLTLVSQHQVELGAAQTVAVVADFGPSSARRWEPENPVLHDLLVDVQAASGGVAALSDRRRMRYGLRTLRLDSGRLLLNERPYRMKSVLVQGFRAEQLYAEGTTEQIVEEVRAAQAMGFTMVRLHIKGFDPRYLDVCDEVGMLVHSDLPIAEPIAHSELGDGSELSSRAVAAVTQQVRRDRNHPSIVLWSAMNELGLDGEGSRQSAEYEEFARTLYAAVVATDPTRPVIENDWVEPDPDRVFCSPILTAHWYGRLHADYLDKLERACQDWAGTGRPLYVTEFGDWGLPDMPEAAAPPFWDPREVYLIGLAATLWPATIGRFVRETQRYQGLSDRLQIEVFRRHDHIGGYCLTELTDVPHELNGVLDLHRRPKPPAVDEIRRANQNLLPMLVLDSLVVRAGSLVRAPLHLANDGDARTEVEIIVRFGGAATVPVERLAGFDAANLTAAQVEGRFTESVTAVQIAHVPAHRAIEVGAVSVFAPLVTGNHDLLLTVSAQGRVIAENRYPVHVVPHADAPYDVQVRGPVGPALEAIGARPGAAGPLIVAEDSLDAAAAADVRARLAAGETVVILAQPPAAAPHYPVPVELAAVETEWGSSVFHFTTDTAALPSMPRRNVLAAEESTIQARSAIVALGEGRFPTEPVVIVYKPVPGSITGWVVGAHEVGPGRLICCQYRLTERALTEDAAAQALLADVVRWAADPRPPTRSRSEPMPDGRSLTYYSYPEGSA
ncbi:MAG TPA: glycoside hydrolase family 2 TIM barrel-domain containing protein [Sporichthya sp.]|nr:glycoside hydrolase family 2 TIM barrel-domain containing protein [Sporichthya sp.]